MEEQRTYRRNLPHIQPEGATFFITYNLDGALPSKVVAELRHARALEIQKIKAQEGELSEQELKKRLRKAHDLYFGKYEELLDDPKSGPTFLRKPEIAQIVKDSLHHLDGKKYTLICYCIMPNHVHKIVKDTKQVLFRIMQSHKGFTGFEANRAMSREGQFWHRESFDHQIRSDNWLKEKIQYILLNPSKAKLVKDWRAWPHWYIHPDYEWMAPSPVPPTFRLE